MKTIPLTQGMVAVVDDDDYDFLAHWKWHASECNGFWYAKRNEGSHGNQTVIYMHRVIAGAVKGQEVDHENRNTLDNRRENLRISTRSQNNGNHGLSQLNTSGFKGVTWSKKQKTWVAQIHGNGKGKFLGHFLTPEKAARAYDEAAKIRYGDFALTNEKLGLFPKREDANANS